MWQLEALRWPDSADTVIGQRQRDLIMLSQIALREDINGCSVLLVEGLPVEVQKNNPYDDGTYEVLTGRGVVEANSTGHLVPPQMALPI